MNLTKILILVLLISSACADSSSNPYKNWGLYNQSNSNIDAVDAWNLESGDKKLVVAVIDTGIDANHRDLKDNIWHNPKNPSEYGYNFVLNKTNPIDDHGHGTHVAGIIGAVSDTQAGVSGVTHHVSIMAVKYYSDANSGIVNLSNTVKAINYAVDNGAKIINYSGGGPEYSEEEYEAIKRANDKGVLFVCAAGNEHTNSDVEGDRYYPAGYRLPNMISVASTDQHNNLVPSSNWGHKSIDVAAPGENIYSVLPTNRFGYMSGTSQATAFVTGIAALVWSKYPKLKASQVKNLILSSVDKFPQLDEKLITGGRVNAYSALMAGKNGN